MLAENWESEIERRIDVATKYVESYDCDEADQLATEAASDYAQELGIPEGSDDYETLMAYAMLYVSGQFPTPSNYLG